MNVDVVQALTHGADVVYNCTHAPYHYLEPQIVDASDMAQQFGLHATPLATALPTTLAWYREQTTQPV